MAASNRRNSNFLAQDLNRLPMDFQKDAYLGARESLV